MPAYLAGITGALCLVLFLEHVRTGAVYRVPFFCLYLLVWVGKLGMWAYALAHPPGLGWLPWIEPLMIGLKLCMFLEAAALVTVQMDQRERGSFLGLLGCCGGTAVLVTIGSHSSLYLAIRNYSNVALAMASLVGMGCFWMAPLRVARADRSHAAILTLYFCNMAVCGLLPAKSGAIWRAMNAAYFAGALLCCVLWMRYGLIRRITDSRLAIR